MKAMIAQLRKNYKASKNAAVFFIVKKTLRRGIALPVVLNISFVFGGSLSPKHSGQRQASQCSFKALRAIASDTVWKRLNSSQKRKKKLCSPFAHIMMK